MKPRRPRSPDATVSRSGDRDLADEPVDEPARRETHGAVVLPFVPRAPREPPLVTEAPSPAPSDPDDFAHRMRANLAALAVVAALMGAGWWLATTMAQMRKDQDCVLSGRRGCTPVTVPAGSR